MSHLCASRQAFSTVAVIFGVYHVVAIAVCILNIEERPASQAAAKVKVPLIGSVLRAFRNKAFKPLLFAWALDGLALTSLLTMFPFFVRYWIKSDGATAQRNGVAMDPAVCMGLSVVAMLFMAMLSSPVWLWLSARFSKYQAWLVYNVFNVLTNLLLFVPQEGQTRLMILIAGANGIPVGGQFLINSILADVIDYDEFLHGSRSEGSYSVFATLIPKFVAIPASAIPLALINSIGFRGPVDGVAQHQPRLVETFIRLMFVLFPFVSFFVAIFIKLRFPIKTRETAQKISEGISLQGIGEPAADPLTGRVVDNSWVTDAERRAIWVLEHFSDAQLRLLVDGPPGDAAGGPARLRASARALLVGSAAFCATWVVVAGATFRFLHSPKLSIVPVLAIILFGLSFAYACVGWVRWRNAVGMVEGMAGGAEAGTYRRLAAERLNGGRNEGRNGTVNGAAVGMVEGGVRRSSVTANPVRLMEPGDDGGDDGGEEWKKRATRAKQSTDSLMMEMTGEDGDTGAAGWGGKGGGGGAGGANTFNPLFGP